MKLFNIKRAAEGATYTVLRRFQWNGGIAAVGDVITVEELTVTTEDVPGNRERASTTYQGLPGDVTPA